MPLDRRSALKALACAVALLSAGSLTASRAQAAVLGPWTTQTLEAFADTLIPGERRYPGDLAVAGVVSGPGAVQAGALQLLTDPALPLGPWLPDIASLLDVRALAWAAAHVIWLPPTWPPFVGLPFGHRTGLLTQLYAAGEVDQPIWQTFGLLIGLAFDTAGHEHTAPALAAGHPGLTWIGFPPPGPDGLWRFPDHSYNRPLADLHPATTPCGSPA